MRLFGHIIGYGLVVVGALSTATVLALGLELFSRWRENCCDGAVQTTSVHLPQVRSECDRQFFSSSSSVSRSVLDAGSEVELLGAFIEPQATLPPSPSDGVEKQPTRTGFVLIRTQPQYASAYTQTPQNASPKVEKNTIWEDVKLSLVQHINPVRQDLICDQSARFREGRFELYCEFPLRFKPADAGMKTYRVYMANQSAVPIEYCIVSNCDASAPYGSGTMCQSEQIEHPVWVRPPPPPSGLLPARPQGWVRPMSSRVLGADKTATE